jgi:glycosyltransferase involved in cell wall biosynthesis
MKLTIIIPIYNEEAILPQVLPEIIEFCKSGEFELILVNDGSTDNSLEIIDRLTKNHNGRLKIVSHKLNRGYGGALKTGISNSQSEYSIFFDADGQHRLEDVNNLYNKIRSTDADMIIGSRIEQKGNFWRRMGKFLIRGIARLLMDLTVYDINSGMKIFRTEIGRKYLHLYPDTMSFSDIICLVFINNRHLVLEEPIQIMERKGGRSTIGIHTAFETFMEIINIITLFSPMKIFLTISILLFLAGIGWGLKFLIKGLGVSIGSSMLIIISILVFLLGLIAEQLASIRRNTK